MRPIGKAGLEGHRLGGDKLPRQTNAGSQSYQAREKLSQCDSTRFHRDFMSILKGCTPRFEVLKGDLDDAIFAADFGDLVAGKAPLVYADAKTFFQNTHPAIPLCKVVQAVFERLSNPKEGGITLRLSTGFGGGKTHALMALWHLAENISDLSIGQELLPASGRPKGVTVKAVDLSKAGLPQFNKHGATQVKSLWGELFFLLKGKEGLSILGSADDPEASPNDVQIEQVLPAGPLLFLLDEIVIYMAKLSERGQGNLLGFINLLAGVVRNRPQTCLVVTDPGRQAAYADQSAKLGALLASAVKLDEIYGRKMSDLDPIGDEAAKVIVRRLFERVDGEAAKQATKVYAQLYQRVSAADPKLLPTDAPASNYTKKIAESYPFHPRLLATAQDRLAALDDFQKSRGVLRLFARILRDVWEAGADHDLISAGEINWSSARIQSDLLQRLNRDRFKPAISADIEGHARDLDGGQRGIHVRTASALLLESLPMTANSGLDPTEITLATLRPDEAGQEPSEAMDRLVGVCWHTYPMAGGRGWQFRFDANIIRQIDERRSKVSREDAISRLQAELLNYFQGPAFRLCPWPSSASQVPESADLQLVLCEDEKIAKSVVTYCDDRDPNAPVPRGFKNAIIAITSTESKRDQAIDRAQRLMAAEQIERENKGDKAAAELRDQLGRLMPELKKQFLVQTFRSFDRVVLSGGSPYTIEEQYQVAEAQVLQRPNGQQGLRRFLDDKNLVYKPTDSIDSGKFANNILPGTTPVSGETEVFTAKSVHERLLAAPGLRLVPGDDVVRNTLLKAIGDAKIVVKTPDGRAYDRKGCVEGETGQRKRTPDTLNTLVLDDSVLITPEGSATAVAWLKEDGVGGKGEKGGGGRKPPPPPPPSQVSAQTWPKILEYAALRPILNLKLTAPNPAVAAMLATLAQPLGADSLSLEVMVDGTLRDGGTMRFSASEVKLNHPTRPLQIAQTIFNSMAADAGYTAVLSLNFNAPGRTGLAEALKLISTDAPPEVKPQALFDKPSAANVPL